MTQDSDAMDSPWPSAAAAAVAAAPAAPVAAPGMTVGGVLTVAGILTLFVLCALSLFLLQYCFQAQGRRTGTTPPRRLAADGSTRTTRGVDPELLRSLPVTVYRAPTKDDVAVVECAVCLAELEDGEEARFLPRCGHGFHAECVDMWLTSHSTCPLCRLTVCKPDAPPAPALVLALPPVRPEPANYAAANVPSSVLLGFSDQGAVTTTTNGGSGRPSTGATGVLVIEIPDSAALTPCDVAKSPGSARLRSIRRLWSFGRQGAGPSSSCSCASAGEGTAVEQSISVTITDMPLPSEAAAGATRSGAVL